MFAIGVRSDQPERTLVQVGLHGYYFFGHHISDSAVTGLAFLSTIDVIIGVICTFPGGLLADYFAERRAVVMTIGGLLTVFQPVLNAYFPTFTMVCAGNILGDIVSGLTSPCYAALLCDCLPTDSKTGLAVDPARDYLIMGYAGRIPEILIPVVLGLAFSCFQDRATAYKVFFLISAAIHLCSAFMFLKVDQELRRERQGRNEQADEEASGPQAAHSAPIGARLCDALLFGGQRGRGYDRGRPIN